MNSTFKQRAGTSGWLCASAITALLLAGCAHTRTVAEPAGLPPTIAPVKARITDSVIATDLKVIESLRARLKKLNDEGRPLDDYHLCKARAWLDLGYDEYTDNDRSGIVAEALDESRKLIEGMEAKDPAITLDTTLIKGADRIRPDIWDFAAAKKRDGLLSGKACSAACALARMEVRIVWAGEEYAQLGWRHAESEIMATERLQREVAGGESDCRAVPAPVLAASAPRLCPALAPLALPDNVHFAYDRWALSPATRSVLDRVAAVMRERSDLAAVLLGRADEHHKRGFPYQRELSRKRATAVRDYLIAAGVAPGRLRISALGLTPSEPGLPDLQARAQARRVEMVFECAVVNRQPQEADLQPDR